MNFHYRLKRLLSAFLEACTFDNWRHIRQAECCCLSFFWILVQVVTILASIYFVYLSVITYMQRATTTNVIVEVNRDEPVPFPQITFCRQNPYKTEELAKHLPLTHMMYKFIAKLYGTEQAQINVHQVLSQQYSGSVLDCIMQQIPDTVPDVSLCDETPRAKRAARRLYSIATPNPALALPDEINLGCDENFAENITTDCGLSTCNNVPTPDTLETQCVKEVPAPIQQSPPAPSMSPSNQLQVTTEAEATIAYAISQLGEDMIRNMSYKLEEMLKSCKFNSMPCDLGRDFTDFVSFPMGVCYMYNNAKPGREEPRNATRAGVQGGLTLAFHIEVASALKMLAKDGVKMMVTTPGSVVLPQSTGFVIAPGYAYNIAVNLVKINRIRDGGRCFPPRFVEETDTDITYYYYGRTYGVVGCLTSCQQKIMNDTCGCVDPNVDSKSKDMAYCTGDDKSCVEEMYKDLMLRKDCETACTPECEEGAYTITQSVVKYPADGYVPLECADPDGTNQSCLHEYSDKVSVSNIYFRQLTYEKMEEEWAYDSMRMFTDITNTIGLYVGIGVISVIELLILPLLCLCACFPHFIIEDDDKMK